MRKISLILLFVFLNTIMYGIEPYNKGVNVTPAPLSLVKKEGKFVLDNKTVFVANGEGISKVAEFFAAKLERSTSYSLDVIKKKPKSNYIELKLDSSLETNDEGYYLTSAQNSIEIVAKTSQGVFYGLQTLMQLLPAEIESHIVVKNIEWQLPLVSIKDEPRFKYRGHHIDVSRHFADVEFLKKQIDLLSMFKLNVLHWHLIDDQGWRIEIKKYPKLTQEGATRKEGDGSVYGPFYYTQDEIREIVAYAKKRFVEVIPEVELPGHAVAAISAYPYLSCTGKQIDVRNYWGVSSDAFCAGNDEVFTFWEDVIKEVAPLFESKYFHIGGDECLKARWKACPKCQERINKENLVADSKYTAEDKLQSYFVNRVEKMVLAQNKIMIGWDEILEGGLAPSAVVMSWRGEEGGIEAANMGHDVIMTPGGWMYLDKFQGESKLLPVTIGGVKEENNMLPLSKVYSYDPLPAELNEDKRHHVIGVQANSWHEYKYTTADMHHDMFPRLIALSEVAWSSISNKNYADFERRIDNQRVRLDMYDVNYYIPTPENTNSPSCNFVAFIDEAKLSLKTTEPVKIVYTTDNTEPTIDSPIYTETLVFNENTTLKTRSILLSNKMGPVRTVIFEKQTYAPSIESPSDYEKGLEAKYYQGNLLDVTNLESMTPDEVERVSSPKDAKYIVKGYLEVYEESYYSTMLTGYINIPEDGVYYFSTDEELYINDELLISNAQNVTKARRFSGNDQSIALAKGLHKFKLKRAGAIFGGWPTQWSSVSAKIRKEGETSFKELDSSFFKQ